MKINEFIDSLKELNINISEEQLNQLNTYKEFMQEYNKHTNLTRIIDDEEVYLKHFYDSLTICKYVDLNNYNNLLDLGTGAGFPGMVLKIMFPNLKVTLLDSNNKKITFLKELSEKLNIDVELIQDRAEVFAKTRRESFDIVTSRAMANLRVLLELSIPFNNVDGLFIAMKANAEEEIKEASNTHELLGSKLVSINEFYLKDNKRTIIIYKKEKETNSIYPREYNIILKKPIKK